MYESIDDLTAPWVRLGADLARRMLALADEIEASPPFSLMAGPAERIREVIRVDYNPLPHLPELGDPPTIRPAVPPVGKLICTAAGPDGAECERPAGHGERHGFVGDGELVLW